MRGRFNSRGFEEREQRADNRARELQESRYLLKKILDISPNFIYLLDLDRQEIIYVNREMAEFFGTPPAEFKSMGIQLIENGVHPEDLHLYAERQQRLQAISDHETVEAEFRVRNQHGIYRWLHCRSNLFSRTAEGAPSQILCTSQDVTEQRALQEQLKRLSYRDPLTDLYNRTYFEEEIERLSNPRFFPVSILMIDADDLKETNDCYGHMVGDELLCRLAEIMKSVVRSSDVAARFGGDEFAVLLPNTGPEDAKQVVERVRARLLISNSVENRVVLKVSIGTATASAGEDLLKVLHRADESMYLEKFRRTGRGQRHRLT